MTLTFRLGLYDFDPAPPDLPSGWTYRSATRAVTSDWHLAYAHRHAANLVTATKLDKLAEEEHAKLMPSWQMDHDYDPPAPPGKTYFNYQKAGIAFAMTREHTLIADDPRLGKSMQALGVANAMEARKVVIVCPSNAKDQWKQYCHEWLIRPGKITVVQGRGGWIAGDTIILNWEILTDYVDEIGEADLVVFDESRAMKNERSLRTKAALKLKASKYLYLDGTPINVVPFDLWTIIRRADRWGLGANKSDFCKRYCDAERIPGEWHPDGASNLEELQRRMRLSFMVRREKRDVTDEFVSREEVWLDGDPFRNLIEDERSALTSISARPLTDLLEDIIDGKVAPPAAVISARQSLSIAKVPLVLEYVDRLLTERNKAIIYAHHRAVVQAISEHYADIGVTLMGGVAPNKRASIVAEFQTNPACRVFIGNITACCQAISLSAADDVVYAELSWVPTEMEQSEERPWLMNKHVPIRSHWLMLPDSLDAQMSSILRARMKNIKAALNREHIILT